MILAFVIAVMRCPLFSFKCKLSEVLVKVVGPGFHVRVYARVVEIPFGRVATYGDIATLLGSPNVARHVGWALAALGHRENEVPWHRVINAQGRISFKGQVERADLQRVLLEAEGVVFDRRDRVDLKQFRWRLPLHDEPVTGE